MRFDIGAEINLGFVELAWHPLVVQVEREDHWWLIASSCTFALFGFVVLAAWVERTHYMKPPVPWANSWELGITLLDRPRIWDN